jgi:hypothetical protein
MIQCPKCGYGNETDATSCDVCGASLLREPETIVVPTGTGDAEPETVVDHAEISIQPDGEDYAPPEPEPEDDADPAPPERIDRGGPYCRACGESNFPDRTFCMACGERLELPPKPPRERWWRRLARRRRARMERGRKRRRGPSFGQLIRRTLLLVVVVAALIAVFGPWRAEVRDTASDAYRKVRDAVEQVVEGQAADKVNARTIASYSRCARAAAAWSPACT